MPATDRKAACSVNQTTAQSAINPQPMRSNINLPTTSIDAAPIYFPQTRYSWRATALGKKSPRRPYRLLPRYMLRVGSRMPGFLRTCKSEERPASIIPPIVRQRQICNHRPTKHFRTSIASETPEFLRVYPPSFFYLLARQKVCRGYFTTPHSALRTPYIPPTLNVEP